MLRMLEAQAPAKQNATDTINTLSSRLNSATLLEDRRAAILGLRSFAKEYPASVASGALRGLISSLTKDSEDVDTTKVVLETLLMLFNPNENSPEASDDIALWLADEFTQRQDNITILLDLLETPDFYSRIYSLQLIQAASSARPERTQECILSAPLGTTRLVGILDDPRDAIRNAGLLLLTDLTQSSPELQKLVAFENAFEKIFALIEAEGSLEQGGIVVQDCLSLLANLVRYNAPNQSLFRETGCVAKLAQLLPGGRKKVANSEEDNWASPQKDKNIWGLLAVLRMFLVRGSVGTQQNQNSFSKHRLVQLILNLAFNKQTQIPIKAEALYTCADMIRANPRLQEGFAQLQVTLPIDHGTSTPNGEKSINGISKAYIIDALLDLTLSASPSSTFDARFAACECVKAYFYTHGEIKMHFLNRAIEGHKSGQDETANALTTLILGHHGPQYSDPYRLWFASVLVFHLIFDDLEAKRRLMSVAEGDAEQGEEVVTCIQALSSNLMIGLQTGADERVTVGYLMLLLGWLFEDSKAVNDFLGEGSSLQSLVQAASRAPNGQVVVQGLCAILLGIIYEFSTKDSPIPRRKLQSVLVNSLGRERYLDAITRLRQHPFIRDFEVLSPGSSIASGNLPDVYFDSTFVDFIKDNFSRLSRAIDRDPGLEVQQSHEGIDRDLLDNLKAQLAEKDKALQKAENEALTVEGKLGKEQADHRRSQETAIAEVNRIKNINEALQRNHDAESRKAEEQYRAALQRQEEQSRQQIHAINLQMQQNQREASSTASRVKEQFDRELSQWKRANSELEDKLKKIQQAHFNTGTQLKESENEIKKLNDEISIITKTVDGLKAQLRDKGSERDELRSQNLELEVTIEKQRTQIETLNRSLEKNRTDIQDVNRQIKDSEANLQQVEKELTQAQEELKQTRKDLAEKEEARSSVQAELDDMLIILSDLEDKRTNDKKRLKELGQETSDAEVDDDEDEDGDEGEDEDDEDVD